MSRRIRIVATLNFLLGLSTVALAQGRGDTPTSSSFKSQEVKFDGHAVTLAGTLLVPKLEAGKRAPAVLINGHSRHSTRNGVTFGEATHTIYRDIAEYLAARGMAVLRYDRRCAGTSECKPAETISDYVDDAGGALKFLRSQAQIDPSRIFLFGHDEGGFITASVAVHDEGKLAGIIVAAMAGRTLGKVVRGQVQTGMKEAGRSESEIAAYLAKYDRVVRGMAGGRNDFPEVKLDPQDPFDAILTEMLKQQQVTVNLLINDPLQVIASVKAPILILQGKKDMMVGVKDSQFIEEALKRVYHPDTTLQLLDDVDHLLKTNKGAATLSSYEDASRPLDPLMLKSLTDWMEKKLTTVKVASDKN